MQAHRVANPGCFATCIQLGLLPAAHLNLLKEDVSVNAITGSTGAGQKPGATTHFSWRNNNLSIYKPFQHQHIAEIRQSLAQVQGHLDASIDFIPYRGDFARGIFCTEVIRTKAPSDEVIQAYKDYYADAVFTHYSDKSLDLKQVVNTNKCLVHIDAFENKLLVTSCIDNLLKGAVGQAVQNMNIMFGIDETAGLRLKASAF
jgi:N-acetyl-gamma-glutamyl-phosphate reductase